MNKIINLSVRNLIDEEISKINPDDRKFPQIALTSNDEAGNETGCVYIYPLRGYFFQIGGLDADGAIIQGNHFFGGARKYIQKLKQIGMDDYSIKSVFNSEALACILKYMRKASELSIDTSFTIDLSIGTTGIYEDRVWSDFIDYTIKFFSE